MINDPELLKKLIDDDELEDVELQKKRSRTIVKGIAISTSSEKTKKPVRKSCLSCCCKCVGITMLLISLLGIVFLGYAYSYVDYAVQHLTIETDSPQKFPIVELPESELKKIADRVEDFIVDAVEDEKPEIEDLVLTQDEINAFIGHSDYLRGNLMVVLHKNRIVEEFSFPMDVLGYNDRYFAGNEYLGLKNDGEKDLLEMKMESKATHEDWFDGPLYFMQFHYLITKSKEDEGENMLQLYLERGKFFGQVVPEEVIEQHENLLEGLYDADCDDAKMIRSVISAIESVSIEEGKLVVKARRHKNKN